MKCVFWFIAQYMSVWFGQQKYTETNFPCVVRKSYNRKHSYELHFSSRLEVIVKIHENKKRREICEHNFVVIRCCCFWSNFLCEIENRRIVVLCLRVFYFPFLFFFNLLDHNGWFDSVWMKSLNKKKINSF